VFFSGAETDRGIRKGGKQRSASTPWAVIVEEPLQEAQSSLGAKALPRTDGALGVPEDCRRSGFVLANAGQGREIQKVSHETLERFLPWKAAGRQPPPTPARARGMAVKTGLSGHGLPVAQQLAQLGPIEEFLNFLPLAMAEALEQAHPAEEFALIHSRCPGW